MWCEQASSCGLPRPWPWKGPEQSTAIEANRPDRESMGGLGDCSPWNPVTSPSVSPRIAKNFGRAAGFVALVMHKPPAPTADLAVLPGVLGCSFDRLRTSSPCDVLKNTPQVRAPASCPAAQPSPRSRYGVSCTMRASLLRIPKLSDSNPGG